MKNKTIVLVIAILVVAAAGYRWFMSRTASLPATEVVVEDVTVVPSDEPLIGLPNPLVSYDTLADAAAAAGFTLDISGLTGITNPSYTVIDSRVLQLDFTYSGNQLSLRKAAGMDDISGDYNIYEHESLDILDDGTYVTLRGDDDQVKVVLWQRDGYTYSLTSDDSFPYSTGTTIAELAQ